MNIEDPCMREEWALLNYSTLLVFKLRKDAFSTLFRGVACTSVLLVEWGKLCTVGFSAGRPLG